MLPPQLTATTDGWEGVMYTAVQRLLQLLSGSHVTVPLIIRGARQKEQNTQTHTAQRLKAIYLKRVTDHQVTSNNLTTPQTHVASHSQNIVIPKSTQIWFPFDHSLTSSTEVLAKRLIGTCA